MPSRVDQLLMSGLRMSSTGHQHDRASAYIILPGKYANQGVEMMEIINKAWD